MRSGVGFLALLSVLSHCLFFGRIILQLLLTHPGPSRGKIGV